MTTETTRIPRDAHDALWAKAHVQLSGGAYDRTDPRRSLQARAHNLSRYSPYRGVRDGTIAAGVLEGILALLIGQVRSLALTDDGRAGRARVASLSTPGATYAFTWDAAASDGLLLGGFPAGPGGGAQATYHAALLGLVTHWARSRVGGDPPDEVVERWEALLTVMERTYTRLDGSWTRAQVADACQPRVDTTLRDALDGLADSLWLHLRYVLPDTTRMRSLVVQQEPVAAGAAAALVVDPTALLVVPRARAGGAASGSPAPSSGAAAGVSARDPDLDLAREPVLSSPEGKDVEAPVATVEESVDAEEETALVETADGARIRRALRGEGAVFILGPAGQGKTEWAKRLTAESLDGFELVQLTPRVHEEDLYGTNVQDAGGRWVLAPGPVTRWARRVEGGARLALILDEFPRAHPSLRDGVMALLNLHSAADLRAGDLPVPAAPGPYHLVDVPGDRPYVLPAARVKIVATGNAGESYRGLDLSDPAFLDRWAAWVHLAGLSAAETRAVLAAKLGLLPTHALLDVLLTAAEEVEAYRETHLGLRAGVTLRTLLRWGAAVQAELGPRGRGGRWT